MNDELVVSPPPPRMRIAVVGAGGIGSTFAFAFARAGHDVTVVARPGSARLEQLRRDGAIVKDDGESAAVEVLDCLDEAVRYDLVLVTVLAHQVDAVLPTLERSAAKAIQFMFNTFEPERLRDAVGADRCSFGMPFVQAVIDRDGRLDATIGAGGQKTKMNDRVWVRLFSDAGLPAVFEPDMLLWLRCHVPLGAAFESVCVAAVRRGGGASWGDAMRIARGMRESFTLIARLGFRIYPAGKARLHASPVWAVAGMLWCVSRVPSFRDLLATGENECRALVDVLARYAGRVGPGVSVGLILGMKPE